MTLNIPPFETTFNVSLTCEDCIKSVADSLYKIDGIRNVDANLNSQLVRVEGNAAPSAIVAAIEATGRDAILRGSGKSDNAAVCILETHAPNVQDYVRGLIRIVQVAPMMTIFDISIKGLSPGTYHASVRESGDISAGPESTGSLWELARAQKDSPCPRALLGIIEVSKSGIAAIFVDKPIEVWEMIGRSIVVSKTRGTDGDYGREKFSKDDPDTVVGVIARSAGVWENEKMVCSCSGKTVWEERREQSKKGVL